MTDARPPGGPPPPVPAADGPPDRHGRPHPRLVLLTDRHRAAAAGHDLEEAVAAALSAGAPVVVLRERDLPHADRRALALRIRRRADEVGAQLWLGGDPTLAAEVGADGVHLPSAAPVLRAPGVATTGRSCHDVDEVAAAVAAGLDHVTVSPVAPSASKPGHGPSLGPQGLATLAATAAPLRVYALGGVTAADVPRWLAAGADGVAVLGAILAAPDPAAATTRLVTALAATPSTADPGSRP